MNRIRTEEIFEYNPADLELHPLALTTPRMIDENYEALKRDIEANGQLEPVVLYRGRIVDGRHRWLILQELGITAIYVVKLPHNTDATTLKTIVRSKEIRRHETPTQLAISGYKLMVENKDRMSQSKAADTVGADRRKVGEAKKIAVDYNRPDILEILFHGEKINISTDYKPHWTDSLPAIINWLKDKDRGLQVKRKRGQIEMTEEQFLECSVKSKEIMGMDIRQIKHIAKTLYSHVNEYEDMLVEQQERLGE
jgi:hypothetical protein